MNENDTNTHARWARFRFSVVGSLLAAPPPRGTLRTALEALASRTWTHPITGTPTQVGFSTIEHWYYVAKNAAADPVRALRRKIRRDAGSHPSLCGALEEAIAAQHKDHRRWTYKLHFDNLGAQVRARAGLGPLPSYSTVRRYMLTKGLRRAKGRRTPATAGGEAAARRFETCEVRSYEATYVGALFHSDFHECSRALVAPDGERRHPHLYGCLDDRSRLACHLQWYWSESARTHAHGTWQAFLKRGIPRAYMTDCGAAQKAAEIREGLERTGVIQELTLPYSPYQNAKMEIFWGSVEGRLIAMLEGVETLTLDQLNEATQAWVELDYNREVHGELGKTPLESWIAGPSVMRDTAGPETLRDAFRRTVTRRPRHSDGTVSIEGRRYEVPSRYAHLDSVGVRYAKWDLSWVHLVDRRTDTVLCRLLPLDKAKNADGRRRRREGPAFSERGTPLGPPASGMAPLLKECMDEYAAQGLPPAYLPLDEEQEEKKKNTKKKNRTDERGQA
jgi:transposase InsO family protein